MSDKSSLTYREAGVDIDAGNALVARIKGYAESTRRSEVLAGLGGFGGLFALPVSRYRNPVLVSGTDGVGTKLKLAIETGRHDTIGVDLVAMCVNDVVVAGAEPLFFLDYYATGRLELEIAEAVIKGIADGCRQAGAALIGGETAELPGMYRDGDYDLAGFCVGIVEREKIIDGSKLRPGDRLVGLRSSGPHSNGYSLIRKVLERTGDALDMDLDGIPLGDRLLAPTRIYVPAVLGVLDRIEVRAMAHITGGGLPENLPRVLGDGISARVDTGSWEPQPVFEWIRTGGNVSRQEMFRTFNCGIGMVLVVAADQAQACADALVARGEQATVIGEIVAGGQGVVLA